MIPVYTDKRGKPLAVQSKPGEMLVTRRFYTALARSDKVIVERSNSYAPVLGGITIYTVKEREVRREIQRLKRKLGVKHL